MHGIMGDTPSHAGSLMPPATTTHHLERPRGTAREARLAPPFIPSAPPAQQIQLEPQPGLVEELSPLRATADQPLPEPAAAAAEEQPAMADWEEIVAEEGTVEAVFEADTDEVLQALTLHAEDLAPREEFPLEAFIIPEQAQHLPSGLEGKSISPPPGPTPVSSLAERLEKLSHRLRVEETDAIVRRLAAGDRLDSLLAGLLAGYLAGKSEQQQ